MYSLKSLGLEDDEESEVLQNSECFERRHESVESSVSEACEHF